MSNHAWRPVMLMLGLLFLAGCSWIWRPQPQLTALYDAQGGIVVYGVVAGANTQAAALGSVLRTVHNSCGDKPQVGNVFRVNGTNSDAVFFTVVDHPQNDRQAAGMVIAAQTGPKTVEAAMVTDDAGRFSSTVNPLLSQLFSIWHPGGAPSPAIAPAGAGDAPGGNSMGPAGAPGSMPAAYGGGGVPPMQQFMLPDQTARLELPAGWNIDPKLSAGGSTTVNGPQGEYIEMGYMFMAFDPRGQAYQNALRGGTKPSHTVILPSDVDLARYFVEISQALRASNDLGPAPFTIAKVDLVPGTQQGQCVDATGQANPDGRGLKEMRTLLCRMPPNQLGIYRFMVTGYLLPLGASEQQRARANAIMASYNVDVQRVQALSHAAVGPAIAQFQQHQQALMAFTQSQMTRTQQIGAQAAARMNTTEAANRQQWAGFDRQENNNSRQGQGFSNYLLDQSVVQNNDVGDTGMVGHATMWNSTADALVKSNPNKYHIVNTPGYWDGVDY